MTPGGFTIAVRKADAWGWVGRYRRMDYVLASTMAWTEAEVWRPTRRWAASVARRRDRRAARIISRRRQPWQQI